ncbi:MAG: hypothetical protein WBI63_01530 [Coriobacteriia bacterium]
MEFSLICPNDGRIEVGLEDVVSVVFRDSDSCDILFACPTCGETLMASLKVPNILMAAMELARLSEGDDADDDAPGPFSEVQFEFIGTTEPDVEEGAGERVERERIEESYCEYFRRQLQRVECVDDLLAEIEGA